MDNFSFGVGFGFAVASQQTQANRHSHLAASHCAPAPNHCPFNHCQDTWAGSSGLAAQLQQMEQLFALLERLLFGGGFEKCHRPRHHHHFFFVKLLTSVTVCCNIAV